MKAFEAVEQPAQVGRWIESERETQENTTTPKTSRKKWLLAATVEVSREAGVVKS